MATTQSPTSTLSESPSGSAGRSLASMRTTARSVVGSVPTTRAGRVRWSESLTSIDCAPSTTWLFVRITRLFAPTSITKPVPSPRSCAARRRCVKGDTSTCSTTVLIVTTLGSASLAIGAKLTG
jgi:hypothetical protein